MPRACALGSRQRVFAESQTGRPLAKGLCREPYWPEAALGKGYFLKKKQLPSGLRVLPSKSPISHTDKDARAPPTQDAVRRRRRPNPPPPADTAPAPAAGPPLPCPTRRRRRVPALWWRLLGGRRLPRRVFVGSLALRRRRGRTHQVCAHPSALPSNPRYGSPDPISEPAGYEGVRTQQI